MCKCPFLTTSKEVVKCFKECCFFKGDNKNCPFILYEEEKKSYKVAHEVEEINLFKEDENQLMYNSY